MMRGGALFLCIGMFLQLPLAADGQGIPAAEPELRIYATHGGVDLKAYVFSAQNVEGRHRLPAIVLFHGGGWAIGDPEWAFPRARHFAERGMVAIAAQYRLSDEKTITPLEAMADARAVIRWMREQSESLGIDPERIAAYGWSAGAHLAVSAALFDDAPVSEISAAPNTLVLVSPAVALQSDAYVQRLLGKRADARDISPDEHVRKGLPPMLILQGNVDTVTPLVGVKRFCDRVQAAGNTCELRVYEGYGHLFTPAGVPDDGMPQPDAATAADALGQADRFLQALGFQK
ncbi:MAG TPA: alpha/beta hydrolase [Candidatus Krumholzibacteria bacterium]|nr:alpha/beta hydrolase [Candidatus Krumholzibacteria bacterium]